MDDWNTRQWVDFESSERSAIDDEDFFDTSHKLRLSNGTQYDSCVDSTNVSTDYGTPMTSGASYQTPTRCSKGSTHDVSLLNAMSSLQIKSATKIKTRLASTPNALRRQKIIAYTANSSISRVTEESNDEAEKRKSAASSTKNAESGETVDDEYDKNNCTLVADECEKSFTLSMIIPEKLDTEKKISIVDGEASLGIFPESDANREIFGGRDDEESAAGNESIMSPLKPFGGSIRDDEKHEDLPISLNTEIYSEILISKDVESAEEIISKISELVDRSDSPERSIPDDGIEENIPIAEEISTIRVGNPHKEEMSIEEKSNLEKLVTRLDPPKRPIIDKKNPTTGAAKPRVLTSQVARRYSLSKYRRRSNQYIGLAEAVAKFQFGTPERFRSKPKNDKNAGPLPKRVKQTATKVTYAVSPVLLSKLRARTVAMPTSEKPAAATAASEVSKNISKKTVASTEPKTSTNLWKNRPKSVASTESKTSTNLSRNRPKSVAPADPKTSTNLSKIRAKSVASTERKTSVNIPRVRTKSVTSTVVKSPPEIPEAPDSLAIALAPSSQKTPMKTSALLGDSFVNGDKKKNLSRLSRTPGKILLPSVVSIDEQDVVLKDVEILHYGIPINTQYKNKNITRPIPFSFETRNQESKNKKDKLKDENKEIADQKTKKSIFHAKPAPSFAKATSTTVTSKPSSTALKPKDGNMNAARTLSFQERNELMLRKKKKIFDEVVEKEKKARIFRAKPAPNFKPIFVRGASAENLRSNTSDNNAAKDNTERNRGLSPATRGRGLSQDSLVSNQENKAPNFAATAMPRCPKFKNPLIVQNFKIKKTAEK